MVLCDTSGVHRNCTVSIMLKLDSGIDCDEAILLYYSSAPGTLKRRGIVPKQSRL